VYLRNCVHVCGYVRFSLQLMHLLENGLYQAESSGNFVLIYIGDFSNIECIYWSDLLKFKYKKTFKI
jgi:hypothetical protein